MPAPLPITACKNARCVPIRTPVSLSCSFARSFVRLCAHGAPPTCCTRRRTRGFEGCCCCGRWSVVVVGLSAPSRGCVALEMLMETVSAPRLAMTEAAQSLSAAKPKARAIHRTSCLLSNTRTWVSCSYSLLTKSLSVRPVSRCAGCRDAYRPRLHGRQRCLVVSTGAGR